MTSVFAPAAPVAWYPVHSALTELAWEDERTDVHAVALRSQGINARGAYVSYECACGFDTGERRTDFDATAALISHALRTCAVCHREKPTDNFPRCSAHAF